MLGSVPQLANVLSMVQELRDRSELVCVRDEMQGSDQRDDAVRVALLTTEWTVDWSLQRSDQCMREVTDKQPSAALTIDAAPTVPTDDEALRRGGPLRNSVRDGLQPLRERSELASVRDEMLRREARAREWSPESDSMRSVAHDVDDLQLREEFESTCPRGERQGRDQRWREVHDAPRSPDQQCALIVQRSNQRVRVADDKQPVRALEVVEVLHSKPRMRTFTCRAIVPLGPGAIQREGSKLAMVQDEMHSLREGSELACQRDEMLAKDQRVDVVSGVPRTTDVKGDLRTQYRDQRVREADDNHTVALSGSPTPFST